MTDVRDNARRPASRATALRKPLALAAASLMLSAVALPSTAATWWSSHPHVSIGRATINVRSKGAAGNGRHDDTAAIQAAINALPSSGGTVYLPAGHYMVNATHSIRLRSHVRLLLSSGAQIRALPTSAGRYAIIRAVRVNNVEITGGQIIGERTRHRGRSGEWGYGIDILASSRVFVHDITVADCWGDGLIVGALGPRGRATPSTDVTLNHVVSTGNRRQGLSVTPVNRLYVVNSTFKGTHGTNPESGIDIEPQYQGPANNIRIERSSLSGNYGNGLEVHDNVHGLVVTGSTLKGNRGYGALLLGPVSGSLVSSQASTNGLKGMGLRGRTGHFRVSGNSLMYNSANYFRARHKSIYSHSNSGRRRDLEITGSTYAISVGSNRYSP